MLLKDKRAVIYGGGGAIGGAVARAFTAEGACVFLAGRTLAKLDKVAQQIRATGGVADVAQVDALDEQSLHEHAKDIASKAGGVDIMLNAIGVLHVQGTPFTQLSLTDYMHPITSYMRSYFLTAKVIAPYMPEGSVILTLSTPGSRLAGSGFMGYGVTCAATEAFSRVLAAELASQGVRVICLRSHAIPEAAAAGSHCYDVFRPFAERFGMSVEGLLEDSATRTLLKRLPTLSEIAGAAVFAASEKSGGMTGAILNMSCGLLVD